MLRLLMPQAVTVAAIDRLIHHATILEMNGDSYRRRTAAGRRSAEAAVTPTTTSDNSGTQATDNINDKLREVTAE